MPAPLCVIEPISKQMLHHAMARMRPRPVPRAAQSAQRRSVLSAGDEIAGTAGIAVSSCQPEAPMAR